MSLALTAGKARKHHKKGHKKRSGSRKHGGSVALTAGGKKRSTRKRSHSRRGSRHGGATANPEPMPIYGGAQDFQDYAQVGGAAAPSFYDSYAAYADPRYAGAYDAYYNAPVDTRVAGAYDMSYDPRYGGAQFAPADPYAEWAAQARYAGDAYDAYAMPQQPLVGAGELDLVAGGKKRRKRSHSRKGHKKSKRTGGTATVASRVAGGKRRKRSHSRKGHKKSKKGGLSTATSLFAEQPALVGGFDYPMMQQPMGADLVGGGKKKKRSHSHKRKRSSSRKHGGSAVRVASRSTSRSRSRSVSRVAGGKRRRSHSRKHRKGSKKHGGVTAVQAPSLIGGYGPYGAYGVDPLVGGAYYAPLVGGDAFAEPAVLAGGKGKKRSHHKRRRSSSRKH